MTELLELYNLADEHGIPVYWFDLNTAESLSCRLGDGNNAIAMNPWSMTTIADEKVKLAHELGHCETDSFYNRYSPFDIRAQHENRADRWAIKKLIPKDELRAAVACGYTNVWELSEIFNVTENFMKKAIEYYEVHHENT